MMLSRFVARMCPVAAMVLFATALPAQNYPNKSIRIVTSEAGGGNDFVARIIAQALSRSLGQQVIVDNRGGALIAVETVAKAPPDGYILLASAQAHWIGPLLRKVSYDPVRDFSPISLTTRTPSILVVHPSVPVKSVRDLIDLAKARPGELNYGTPSIGAANHLAAELFKAMAGVNIVHIPFKGSGPSIINLIGGQVQLMFPNLASVAPHIKSGKLRAMAVTSAEPSALAPGLPAVAATLPGYEIVDSKALFAPRGTPAAIVNRLNREVVRVLNQTDVKEMFFNAGVDTVGSSPEQLVATVESEIAKLGKVIKDAGIRAD